MIRDAHLQTLRELVELSERDLAGYRRIVNAAVIFALVVGSFAVVLADEALLKHRWLEAGICIGAIAVCAILAVAAGQPAVPLWLLLLAVWQVVTLVGLTAWSLLRLREKARTGEETR